MSGPLVDAGWLAANLATVKVADVRSTGSSLLNRAAYDAGHIPGAVFFDMEADLAGPGEGRHPLPDAHGFAALLGERGIGSDDTVVAYDDAGGGAACRMWWMVNSIGGRAVLLDGGLQAWVDQGGEITSDPPDPEPAEFAGSDWSGVVSGADLALRLGHVTLLDARSTDRFHGRNETLDPVAGHIPGARSVPYADNLDETGRFKSPDELRALYGEVDGDVVAYCGSGVTACHTLLALELAGVGGAKLYPGSWSGWIADPSRPRA